MYRLQDINDNTNLFLLHGVSGKGTGRPSLAPDQKVQAPEVLEPSRSKGAAGQTLGCSAARPRPRPASHPNHWTRLHAQGRLDTHAAPNSSAQRSAAKHCQQHQQQHGTAQDKTRRGETVAARRMGRHSLAHAGARIAWPCHGRRRRPQLPTRQRWQTDRRVASTHDVPSVSDAARLTTRPSQSQNQETLGSGLQAECKRVDTQQCPRTVMERCLIHTNRCLKHARTHARTHVVKCVWA